MGIHTADNLGIHTNYIVLLQTKRIQSAIEALQYLQLTDNELAVTDPGFKKQ